MLELSIGSSYNTEVRQRHDFLTYKGGGVDTWAKDRRDIPRDDIGGNWDGATGVSFGDAPMDYNWTLSAGGKRELGYGYRIGGFASFFYERNASYFEDGVDDKYWVETPGAPMTPQYGQGSPDQGDFKTSLFDITQGSEEVKWGALGVLGIESDNHSLSLTHMYTRTAEDVATLAEDTRGKAYYFPGYRKDDPQHPGNQQPDAAPYLRTETLEYTERVTETWQLRGRHRIPFYEFNVEQFLTTLNPEFDWTLATSEASMYQPDKRQFGSLWHAPSYNPGFPPSVPPFDTPPTHEPYKPAANFTLGNLQRIWKEITEESNQYFWNLKLPYEQWTGDEGYLKFGMFTDHVTREYNQDSFSNFNDNSGQYIGPWEDFWSREFPSEDHPVSEADIDVDYDGKQDITAWYYMAELPLVSWFSLTAGERFETTELSIVNTPEKDVTWIPPGSPGSVTLNPGDADVDFTQHDRLPSVGFQFRPFESTTLRGNYSETVARQTFKELTPIQQMEFLGGDVFIGNPFLKMSALDNYDLRLDYKPSDETFLSMSYFLKDITDPIEYVQRVADFPYTTAVNYPEGQLDGYEFEVRQGLGRFWNRLNGLNVGGNATFINSEVTLPDEEAEQFEQPNIMAPMRTRDMMNAPEYLYNLFFTYDMDDLGLKGTQIGSFYTVRGDTLVAGAGQSNGKFIPNVYELEYGTLNLSLAQKFGEHCKLQFKAKNILDPDIETVYRSKYIGEDVTKTSYNRGMEFSLGLVLTF